MGTTIEGAELGASVGIDDSALVGSADGFFEGLSLFPTEGEDDRNSIVGSNDGYDEGWVSIIQMNERTELLS